ncbi:MAG TPA: cell envelope integrity protein TolA [Noviherbaspirillum sp.]|nr:cell envelope integrity protein TolA [Noviherbaspirillum sp.]
MTGASQYTVPKEPGLGRALTLAALVHAALLAFLWIGVQWQSNTPATIEAEVWDPQPREAAPLPEPSPPKPVKTPQPEPVVQEPPKPKVVEPPPVIKPDIALEQEKKRKALEEKKRLEDLKLAKLKQEEEKRREAEKAEKEKAEKEKKELAEKKRKQEEADKKMLAKMREEDMRRLAGTGGSGDAPKAQGGRASAEYANRIGAKIKSNITFIVPEGLQGNPPVEYEVRLLPDGSVAGMRKIRSSGLPGFDDAVARAIEKSQPFPRDTNGSVPSSFIGTHKPKD